MVGDGPVQLRPGARPHRRLSDRGRVAFPPLRQDGRASDRASGRERHALCRLGPQCTARVSGRRLQRLERHPPRDAPPRRHRRMGDFPARYRCGPQLQVRYPRPGRHAATAEGGPLRLPVRTAPQDRVDHHRTVRARLGRRRASRQLVEARSPPRADEHLRGPCRQLGSRRKRLVSVVGRAGRPPDPLCRRHGLHPYRIHADQRTPL